MIEWHGLLSIIHELYGYDLVCSQVARFKKKEKRKKTKLSNNFNQWAHSSTQITLIPEGMRQMKRPAQKLPEL